MVNGAEWLSNWQPTYLEPDEYEGMNAAWRSYSNYFDWLKQADRRYVFDYTQPAMDKFESHLDIRVRGLPPDEHIQHEWTSAASILAGELAESQPDVILLAGESGKEIIQATYGLAGQEDFMGIPLVRLSSGDRYVLYKHVLGDSPGDSDYYYEHLARILYERLGDIPTHVNILDEEVSGGVKAYHSWKSLRRAGIARVSYAVLAATQRSELVPFVGSTDIDFWAYMRNLARTVSFLHNSDGKRETHLKYNPDHEPEVRAIGEMVDAILAHITVSTFV